MTRHAFVDESFNGHYLFAAAGVPVGDVGRARRAMRSLLDRRQRRIHFKDERPARKDAILRAIAGLDLEARVYVTKNVRTARETCLTRMVPDLAAAGVTRLVLERDDSVLKFDRKTLYLLTREFTTDLEYQHVRAHEDLMLVAPDAIAWCWAKGGTWKAGVAGYVTEIQL